jgi:hypothetical protein
MAGDDDFKPQGPEEEFLFDPTDRPAEPVTSGTPFGQGPSTIRTPGKTDPVSIQTLAQQIAADPQASLPAKAFATRVNLGE